MTHRNLVRDGMPLSLSEALRLEDDKGNPIKFQLDENYDPMSGRLPSYYCEDREAKKVYTLSIESPYDLVTLRVGDMNKTK
jgi:hypothetical protein